jgi:hypothetical protein
MSAAWSWYDIPQGHPPVKLKPLSECMMQWAALERRLARGCISRAAHAQHLARAQHYESEAARHATVERIAAAARPLDDTDRRILLHALGIDRSPMPHRNHCVCSSGATLTRIGRLVDAGLMRPGKPTVFHVTEAGAEAVGIKLPSPQLLEGND